MTQDNQDIPRVILAQDTSGQRFWWIVVAIVVALLTALMLLMPRVCRIREAANRMSSAGHLKEIGMAFHYYADE